MKFRMLAASLLLQSVASMGPWPSSVELRTNEGETVHATGAFEVFEGDPFMSDGGTTIRVQSDVPVISSRLTAGTSAFLEPPIPFNTALVIVKSTGCDGMDISVDLTNTTDGSNVSLDVTTNTDPTTEFLESSALFRQLECINQMGPPCQKPETEEPVTSATLEPVGQETTTDEGNTPTDAPETPNESISRASQNASVLLSLAVVGISVLLMGKSRGTSLFLLGMGACVVFATSSSTASTSSHILVSASSRDLQQCTINVEVVYWGCEIVMDVTAPALKLRNMQQAATNDQVACNCTSLATFLEVDEPRDGEPYEYLDYEANNTITGTDTLQVPKAAASNCLVAIGRPFRDELGISIVSKTEIKDQNEGEWSNYDKELWKQYNSIPPTKKENNENNQLLAQEWATRALGEHASVASFSAFTIALMSNGAPPNLIQDSLVAAQDELRHAQISFQVASHWMGKNVEPSVLPSSSHYFGSNVMDLAKGVIEEGCIDETLSALQMAADVDANVGGEDEWMWNITRKIALEEGNHSVLAWKTVQWICNQDATICTEMKKEMLQRDRLLAAGKGKHDVSSVVYQAWSCLVGPMACRVTKGTGCYEDEEVCASLAENTLVKQLVHQIKEGMKGSIELEIM